MFIDLSSSLNSTVKKEIFEGSNFSEDYLNLEIEGKTNDKISYRFSKKLNNNKNSVNYKIVDLAYLKYKWNDDLHFLIGKQPIAFGSMEYASSSYDKTFRYSNVLYNKNVENPVGFNLIYHPIKNQELQLQIVNSNSNTKEKEYDNKKWTHPMGGTLNLNCSFFNKMIQSRCSYSIFQENEKNNFWKLLAIGGKLDFKPISMEADYILSDEDVEKNGSITKIIQSMKINNNNHSPSIKYGTYLVKFKYNFLPRWCLIAKGEYETGTSKREFSDLFVKNQLFKRLYTYYGGVEFFPVKNNEDISLHLVYKNQRINYNLDKIKKENKNNHFMILGFSYRVKII
ncbi:porin [Blattabacterium cuenoti]|uniref:porin n=1 Tax=Blattabacterium cuenoti TaxID=1653831 RepID=UPI00163C6648|nr:porin [Blattabacterium cuenoti]